eukprot:CAMPEP_0197047162 /NCGR_PEP_ID=MMETSP1384-20130603/22706_1 /TAXON_ID=29189 /ORGANISM="Ammonia sp." /LENGTH=380 /DNA_ID=CAMNT_0042479039 /DNA_START=22 /DNA_END=1164 /DNA_ORIENTATION=-
MANVALDMNTQNYKYFETNPNPLQANPGGIEHHMMELTHLPDPSLHASPFWRALPHLMGFAFIYVFGGMYFNDDVFYYFPIMFFFPSLIFIFVCLPKQYMFDSSNIPIFVNNLSWGFWVGGLSSYAAATTLNITIPTVLPPASAQSEYYGTHDFKQEQIVFTALVLTTFLDEVIRCYLCHRSFQRYFGLGANTSSINTLMLNCTLNATGMAMAKGFLALCLLGNTDADTSNLDGAHTELIYDYRFALLHYVPKAFIKNDQLYPVLMVVIYALALLPFHSVMGALWGVGFVRRFVLEHTVAFAQILMFPWFFHFVVNIVIGEVFYNVLDADFTDTSTVYILCFAVPITTTILAMVVFYILFKRQIDRSISRLHASDMLING